VYYILGSLGPSKVETFFFAGLLDDLSRPVLLSSHGYSRMT
jgi:hypothetical protein